MLGLPLLLLDIDGVLNVFPSYARTSDHVRLDVDGFRIHLHPEIYPLVQRLEEAFEIVWATMWQDRADEAFAPATGIGPFDRYIDFDAHALSWAGGVGDYKWPGILATAGDRRFAWVDDDITAGQLSWARTEDERVRLVRPDPRVGLTAADVADLIEFATAGQVDESPIHQLDPAA